MYLTVDSLIDINNIKIGSNKFALRKVKTFKKTLWPLFMDGVQPAQG